MKIEATASLMRCQGLEWSCRVKSTGLSHVVYRQHASRTPSGLLAIAGTLAFHSNAPVILQHGREAGNTSLMYLDSGREIFAIAIDQSQIIH